MESYQHFSLCSKQALVLFGISSCLVKGLYIKQVINEAYTTQRKKPYMYCIHIPKEHTSDNT